MSVAPPPQYYSDLSAQIPLGLLPCCKLRIPMPSCACSSITGVLSTACRDCLDTALSHGVSVAGSAPTTGLATRGESCFPVFRTLQCCVSVGRQTPNAALAASYDALAATLAALNQ